MSSILKQNYILVSNDRQCFSLWILSIATHRNVICMDRTFVMTPKPLKQSQLQVCFLIFSYSILGASVGAGDQLEWSVPRG